jgi:TldD protein
MAAVLQEMDALDIARSQILAPAGLDEARLEQVLAALAGPNVDAGELYFQLSRDESWALEDGIVKEGTHSIDQGVGVRAITGERTGFAYSDELVLPALQEAARAARAIARARRQHRPRGRRVQAWRRASRTTCTCRSTRSTRSPTATRSRSSSGSTARPVRSTRA